MGLDMYAYKSKHKPERKCNARDYIKPGTDLRYDSHEKGDEQLHYWRKHPNLHGWMQELYTENEGYINPDGGWVQFNTNSVEIDLDDLEALEKAVKTRQLPYTEGFFFGESYWEDNFPHTDRDSDDLEFIRKAREAIEQGFYVYYTSCW